MTDGLSAADVMALTNNNDGLNGIWNNPFLSKHTDKGTLDGNI